MNLHEDVERRMLDLMERSGLPAPDTIEHGDHVVRFLWADRKVAVVVDIEEREEA